MAALWCNFPCLDTFQALLLGVMCVINFATINCNVIDNRPMHAYAERVTDNSPVITGQTPVDSAIRCSCNLPKCVRYGYMCKSIEGACFVYYNSTENNAKRRAHRQYVFPLQGCVEDLPEETKQQCKQEAELRAGEFSSYDIKKEGLTCCNTNVCNYPQAPLAQRVDHIQRIDPPNSIRLSTEFFAGVCVVAVPILGGIMFMLFLCLGRKILLQDPIYNPVQKEDDSLTKICHHGVTFSPCMHIQQAVAKQIPFGYVGNSPQMDYIAYKNAAYCLSSSSFVSRSLPDLNNLPS